MIRNLPLIILVLALLAALPVSAQRSMQAASSVEQFRPTGERRSWIFIGRDSALGGLTSIIGGHHQIDGSEGVVIEQQLALDFSGIGSPVAFQIVGQQVVASEGDYLGSQMELTMNGITERLQLDRDGQRVAGSASRAGQQNDKEVAFQPGTFLTGDYMLDLYELYLAMHDIRVGAVIEDTLFDPRSLLNVVIKGEVEQFTSVPLAEGHTDSVFAIHLSRPQEQYLFFSPDRRLVRADYPLQGIQAIQTSVEIPGGSSPNRNQRASTVPNQNQNQTQARSQTRTQPMDINALLSYLPRYALLAVIGLISLGLLVGSGLKQRINYLAVLIGGGFFALVTVTQIPLQQYLMRELFLPGLARGGSPYLLALWPALASGAIQEILKSGAILASVRFGKRSVRQAAIIGAFCGAGFGVIEACYTISILAGIPLFSVSLVERVALILLHTSTGALLGWGLSGGGRRWIGMFVVSVVANSAVRYVPIFAQQQAAQLGLLYIVIASLAVVSLIVATLVIRRREPAEG